MLIFSTSFVAEKINTVKRRFVIPIRLGLAAHADLGVMSSIARGASVNRSSSSLSSQLRIPLCVGDAKNVRALPAAVVAPFAARLAIERRLEHPGRRFRQVPLGA
jgi:hypothetical protein